MAPPGAMGVTTPSRCSRFICPATDVEVRLTRCMAFHQTGQGRLHRDLLCYIQSNASQRHLVPHFCRGLQGSEMGGLWAPPDAAVWRHLAGQRNAFPCIWAGAFVSSARQASLLALTNHRIGGQRLGTH